MSCGYQGTMIDDLLGSVDRAFSRASFVSKSQGGEDGTIHAHQVGQQSQRQDHRLSGNSGGAVRVSGFESNHSGAEVPERGQDHQRVDRGVAPGSDGLTDFHSGVVMVETHEPHKLEVAGSNPAAATKSGLNTEVFDGAQCEIASGSEQASLAGAQFGPVDRDSNSAVVPPVGRATAGINEEGAHCSPKSRCVPSVICTHCGLPSESGRLYLCDHCDFEGCGTCMHAHRSEEHWTDAAASRQREAGL